MGMKACQIARRSERQLQGLCLECGGNRGENSTKTLCRPCADNSKARTAKSRSKNPKPPQIFIRMNGKCLNCGQEGEYTEKYEACSQCHFKLLASNYLGSTYRWKEMQNLWIKQSGICPYTGFKLEFGVDASIDHILPSCRFPELSKEISNLEFVHNWVNDMKKDRTKEEFLEFLQMMNVNLFG